MIIPKKVRQYVLRLYVAYRSDQRLMPDRLEATWELKKRSMSFDVEVSNLLHRSYATFVPYGYGFNLHGIAIPRISTKVSIALRKAMKIIETINREYEVFSIILY